MQIFLGVNPENNEYCNLMDETIDSSIARPGTEASGFNQVFRMFIWYDRWYKFRLVHVMLLFSVVLHI